ncbi:DUF167 domain-containing protein [Maridesulfovibrio hydrothermalis]|uniref:UPF0235 protein DESAM_22540 n=1 Tax=Maridesulfovibrio hydrothermalis AM13 = DSM 14728 TaxID=1121451 RepID=L0RF21_9BACT|nr:DUF167 domain-containing protein [Maridesulfovibrio hydrothermalis]CCO24807.1 conserved protein of unknown function [Maridesulfovibrio hydrothermalis AM13 = DSM 14728]
MSIVITELPSYIRPCGSRSWKLSVWVQPGARTEGVTGEYQGSVRVRINAPAVDNKANKALARFVAARLGLKNRNISIASGQTNRKKVLLVESDVEPHWDGIIPTGV